MNQGDDKDGVFFPEPVLSPSGVRSIAFYHRPMLRLSTIDGRGAIPTLLDLPPEERESTRIAYVPLDLSVTLRFAAIWSKLGGEGILRQRFLEALVEAVDAIPAPGAVPALQPLLTSR